MSRHRLLGFAAAVGLVVGGFVVTPASPSLAAPSAAAFDASGKERPFDQSTRSARAKGSPVTQAAQTPECPAVLMPKCSFDPAAYVNNDPADATNYGNYDLANRPNGGVKVKGATVHDIEGTCEDAIQAFKDPLYFASATYVICADGRVIQMAALKDITWTAGNWWYNSHFVQIEVAGFASQPQGYTDAAYNSTALLIKWLGSKYDFPMDRGHVVGHDNVPAQRTSGIASMHVDPGPFFNWQRLMLMLGAPVLPSGNPLTSKMVTIAPVWPLSREVVTGCNVSSQVPPPCVPAGSFPTNFVYLRTQPNMNAPLITDPVTGPGSTEIENRSARAFYGSTFVVADRRVEAKGIWYKIWFDGQGAWFYSPHAAPTAFPTSGECVKPKASLASANVYGRPIPELSEWPANFTPPPGSQPAPTALAYIIPQGQCYAVIDANVTPDHYFSWSFDNTYPRFNVTGATKYVWIWYNGRQGFVKRADVAIAAS